jgi:PTS system sucrose-specific IIC component
MGITIGRFAQNATDYETGIRMRRALNKNIKSTVERVMGQTLQDLAAYYEHITGSSEGFDRQFQIIHVGGDDINCVCNATMAFPFLRFFYANLEGAVMLKSGSVEVPLYMCAGVAFVTEAGTLCVANTAMPLLATYGDAQPIIPMTSQVYNPANGGLIAALLAGAMFAILERTIRKVMPSLVDAFLTPLIVLVVGGLAVVCVLQPVGAVLTEGIYTVMSFVYEELGAFGGFVLAAGFLPLVSVGLHQALTPVNVMLNDPSGPTGGINYLLPILMMAGGGQVGAGLALFLKTKNKRLRGYVRDSIPVGILGVGEPLMYAVTLPLGRPFVTACIGAGFGGVAASLFHLGAVSQGVSGLFGLLIVQAGQQIPYVISMLVAYASGFVLTWLFGVDDQRIDEVYGEREA